MFETCHTPNEVKFWIDEIEKTTIDRGPIDELLEVIYVLQKKIQNHLKYQPLGLS